MFWYKSSIPVAGKKLAHSRMAAKVYAVGNVCGMNRMRIVTKASAMYEYLFLLMERSSLTLFLVESRKNMKSVESMMPISFGKTE